MFSASMDSDLQSALEFEFGIVGEELELSDDESLLSQVAAQASKLEQRVLQDAHFAAWKEDKAGEFQQFLKDLLMELQPRNDDHLVRVNIVTRLASTLEHMVSLRGATLSPFGSFESNLYTRWADLDLSLELPGRGMLLQPISKKVKAQILSSLSRTLIRKGEARNLQCIRHARVPLITFEDSQHSISCDISVDNDAAILKSRLLRWICEVDSRCRDLIFLVKFWAKAHGINDPKVGTLNSFALCLLVIFHLQTRSPPVLPPLSSVLDEDIAKRLKGCEILTEEASKGCCEKIQPYVLQKFGAQNKSSVAELFVTFMYQFSAVTELWSQGLAICTFTGAWGDRISTCPKWRSKRYMMAIEDPFDRSENCARSVQYNTFNLIARAFKCTAEAISHPVIDVRLPSLIESLFLWPVDAQALGLQAWLFKVLSKEGNQRYGQMKSTTVQVVQRHQPHQYNTGDVSFDIFRQKILEAQLRDGLQLDNWVPPVQKKKKKRGKKKLSHDGATVIGGVGLAVNSPELQSGQQDSFYLQRIARKVNKTKVTRKHVLSREGISPSLMDHQVAEKGASVLENHTRNDFWAVREDAKAQTSENNPVTMQTYRQIGAARTPTPNVLKISQKDSVSMDPQKTSFVDFRGAGNLHLSCSREAQRGNPWSAIRRPQNGQVAMGSTETSSLYVPEAHTPSIEEKSHPSATKNVGRQGKLFQKGLPSLSDSTGTPKRGQEVVGRKGGPTVPSPVTAVNNSVRQGEAALQSRRAPSRAAQFWTPRNMGQSTYPTRHYREALPKDEKQDRW